MSSIVKVVLSLLVCILVNVPKSDLSKCTHTHTHTHTDRHSHRQAHTHSQTHTHTHTHTQTHLFYFTYILFVFITFLNSLDFRYCFTVVYFSVCLCTC